MDGFSFLLPALLVLATGVVVIMLSRMAKVSPVVGFVLAGLALGPGALDVIPYNDTTKFLAKLGLVFLLFDLGLNFSMRSAMKLKKDLFGLAPLQMLLCALVLGVSISLIFAVPAKLALIAGIALALSSTAVVLQIVADLKQTESPVGKSSKSILIFQDIVAVFILVFAAGLDDITGLSAAIFDALWKTGLAFGATIICALYIITPLMKAITRTDDPEFFTMLSLMIVILTALATDMAGLSLTLGAFLGGMVMAETPFKNLLQTETRPFRTILIALFFITVGMVLDPQILTEQFDVVAMLAILLIASKAAIIAALAFIFKRPTHQVIQLSFFLGQGSEFAFVVFSLAAVQTAFGVETAQIIIAAIALTMLVTPVLSGIAHRWSLEVCEQIKSRVANIEGEIKNPLWDRPLIIVGMNEVGKTVARALKAHDLPYIAIENNRQRFLEATAAGYVVAFGKPSDYRFWLNLGAGRARAICLAIPDYPMLKNIVPMLKQLYPNLQRYAATEDSADAVRFVTLGLKPFHNKGTPQGLEMACKILHDLGLDEEQVTTWLAEEQSAALEVYDAKDIDPDSLKLLA